MDEVQFKIKLKEFLRRRPGNLTAAAKEFNVSRSYVVNIVETYQAEFDDLDEEFLDELEEQVIKFSRGLLDEGMTLKFNEALKVLQSRRPHRWGKRTATNKPVNKSRGIAAEMLKEFLSTKQEIEKAREEYGTATSAEGEEDGPL